MPEPPSKSAFEAFLRETTHPTSNKAASYVRAIDLLDDILSRKAPDEIGADSIWQLEDPAAIRRLYEFVREHRKLGDKGPFAGENPRSYWEGGFMSAALRGFMEFRVTANHKQRLQEQITANSKASPEELSLLLQNQRVDAIETLTPESVTNFDSPEGKEVLRLTKARVNQRFFRTLILDTYNRRCCLTGIAIPDVLVASHIVPWAEDPKNRLNPCNGLCLNALHDKAFDRGLIGFDDNLRLLLSPRLAEHLDNQTIQASFAGLQGHPLTPPTRFPPDHTFLQRHRKAWAL